VIALKARLPATGTDPEVEAELGLLAVTPIAGLRGRYRELFRSEPPKAFGPDLLRRSIAQRIQEKAYGGLSPPVRRMLDRMMKAYAAQPGGKIVLPRRIRPGSVLIRQWNGTSHRVMVLAEGFAYGGKTFGNLSEIAGLITGTRWNGPRFFGLRSKAQDEIAPKTSNRSGSAKDKSDTAAVRSKFGGGSDYRKQNADQLRKVAPGGHRHGR
jgi:hypothetical protein